MVEFDKKTKRIEEVKQLLSEFSRKYLSEELSRYVFKLWRRIGGISNGIILTKGQAKQMGFLYNT